MIFLVSQKRKVWSHSYLPCQIVRGTVECKVVNDYKYNVDRKVGFTITISFIQLSNIQKHYSKLKTFWYQPFGQQLQSFLNNIAIIKIVGSALSISRWYKLSKEH